MKLLPYFGALQILNSFTSTFIPPAVHEESQFCREVRLLRYKSENQNGHTLRHSLLQMQGSANGVFGRAWQITVSSRPPACHARVLRLNGTHTARDGSRGSRHRWGPSCGASLHSGELQDARRTSHVTKWCPSLPAVLTTPVAWNSWCVQCTCSPSTLFGT